MNSFRDFTRSSYSNASRIHPGILTYFNIFAHISLGTIWKISPDIPSEFPIENLPETPPRIAPGKSLQRFYQRCFQGFLQEFHYDNLSRDYSTYFSSDRSRSFHRDSAMNYFGDFVRAPSRDSTNIFCRNSSRDFIGNSSRCSTSS